MIFSVLRKISWTNSNLESYASKTIELDSATLNRLTSLVQSSMQSAFNKASGEVESIAKEFTSK